MSCKDKSCRSCLKRIWIKSIQIGSNEGIPWNPIWQPASAWILRRAAIAGRGELITKHLTSCCIMLPCCIYKFGTNGKRWQWWLHHHCHFLHLPYQKSPSVCLSQHVGLYTRITKESQQSHIYKQLHVQLMPRYQQNRPYFTLQGLDNAMNLLGKAKPIKSFAYPKHLAQGCTRCFEKGEANQSLEKVLTQFSTRSGLDKDTTFFWLLDAFLRSPERNGYGTRTATESYSCSSPKIPRALNFCAAHGGFASPISERLKNLKSAKRFSALHTELIPRNHFGGNQFGTIRNSPGIRCYDPVLQRQQNARGEASCSEHQCSRCHTSPGTDPLNESKL